MTKPPSSAPPTIAIVGRPNVGKSTLFNRLVGRRIALVDDSPGVTRDRREGGGRLADLRFQLVDTAGLEEGGPGSLAKRMHDQTATAVSSADLALMVIDARAGVTPADDHFAGWLREQATPTLLVANKCEGGKGEDGFYEAFSLGLGEPIAISAEHAGGMGELYDALLAHLGSALLDEPDPVEATGHEDESENGPSEGDLAYEFDDSEGEAERQKPLRLAIIGRPNAGKSTLINHLIGEERVITGPEAGLTRDSIAIPWAWEGQSVMLWDTAGLRRQSRVEDKLESLSVADTRRAIQFAEVVVVLVDATLGVEKQDLKILRDVVDEGRALVIALSKWDLVDDRLAAQRQLEDALKRSMPQARGIATFTLSGLTGQGVQKLMPAVMETYDDWNARIPTGEFNRWLSAGGEAHPPAAPGGRRIKLRYGAQIKTRPPTFVLFCNKPEDLPDSYVRYLENELRRDFDLPGVPLRLYLRKGENPYAGGRRTAKERKANKRRG